MFIKCFDCPTRRNNPIYLTIWTISALLLMKNNREQKFWKKFVPSRQCSGTECFAPAHSSIQTAVKIHFIGIQMVSHIPKSIYQTSYNIFLLPQLIILLGGMKFQSNEEFVCENSSSTFKSLWNRYIAIVTLDTWNVLITKKVILRNKMKISSLTIVFILSFTNSLNFLRMDIFTIKF